MNTREFLIEGLPMFFMKITHVCKKCTFTNKKEQTIEIICP
ncbi:hypothetical protein [Bacillus toyonensis]|nr:hypothetical protein [Bacillus toyonensis]